MDAKFLSEVANSPSVWAICCILLAGFILKKVYEKNDKQEERLTSLHDEYRGESRERESKLMEHLTESNRIQERTSKSLIQVEKTLGSLERGLNSLEGRVDNIEKNSVYSKDNQ